MIGSVADFLDATAFEHAALAAIFPLVSRQDRQGTLDLRTKNITLHLKSIVSVGDGGRNALVEQLRPLVFGCAWKILDLLIEFGLNAAVGQRDWKIEEKQRDAATGQVPPMSTDPDAWPRLCAVYRGTVQARHCLIHRRFVLAGGAMTELRDKHGNLHPDVSASEQDALCRLAQRARVVVEIGSLSARDRLDMVSSLDTLAAHHGLPIIGGGSPSKLPERIVLDAVLNGRVWRIDAPSALAEANRAFPGRQYFDVEINFPGSGFPPLIGRLEDAPKLRDVEIDPSNPPPWIEA
jgi:hypothetical protein